MNKINLKSKKGFTLIELLVVIGILAVLAAIAIPSVAGLIDRANVSADKTNANEYANAVERFVSEYELYKQDIASGTFDKDNMDAAQGRVYNVTGIEERAHIELFESTGHNGRGINIDSKYPKNEETIKAIIQNYTKTSSSTFEPKQSDCQFYYSPEVGGVIVGETGATRTELNNIYFSDSDDATADGNVNWICLDNTAIDNIATDTKNVSETLDTGIKNFQYFTFEGQNFKFEKGMTWREWLSSEYNTNGFYASPSGGYSNSAGINVGSTRYVIRFTATRVNQSITSASELTTSIVAPMRDNSTNLDAPIYALSYYKSPVSDSPMISLNVERDKQTAVQKAIQDGYVFYNDTMIILN